MSLAKSLSHLKFTKPLFEALSAGRHLDASQDPELWNTLCGEHLEGYSQLFSHLGQVLKKDPRGFAYFEIDDVDSKGTRPLALLYLIVFQKQADAGKDLSRFSNWILDGKFFQELREKNQDLLRSENIDSDDRWKTMMNKAVNLGFLAREGSDYLLLPASWRFLDLFLELDEEYRNRSAEAEPEPDIEEEKEDDFQVQDEETE